MSRFTEGCDDEDLENDSPLFGIDKAADVPLAVAVEHARVRQIKQMIVTFKIRSTIYKYSFLPPTCTLTPLLTPLQHNPLLLQPASKLTEDEEKITVSAAMRAMKRLKKKDLLGPLTVEEGASIHIYTQESQLYKNLNSNMRDRVSYVCLHVSCVYSSACYCQCDSHDLSCAFCAFCAFDGGDDAF